MKVQEIVDKTVSELEDLIEEVKDKDDYDLEAYADTFDKISERADKAATTFSSASKALNGESHDDQDMEDDLDPKNKKDKEQSRKQPVKS